jgi:hypothetical protein
MRYGLLLSSGGLPRLTTASCRRSERNTPMLCGTELPHMRSGNKKPRHEFHCTAKESSLAQKPKYIKRKCDASGWNRMTQTSMPISVQVA